MIIILLSMDFSCNTTIVEKLISENCCLRNVSHQPIQNVQVEIRVSFSKLPAVSSCSSRRIVSAPEPRRELDRSAQLTAVSAQPANQEEEPGVQRAGERVRRHLSLRRDGIRLRAGRWRRLGCSVATVPPQTVRWDLLHRLAARPRVDVHPAPSHYITVIWPVHQHRDCQLRLRGLICAVGMSSQTTSQPAEEERTAGHTPAPSSPAALPSPELPSVSTPLRGTGCEL